MTFDQFLRIVWARWKLVVGVLVLVLISTLLVSLIMPKSYKATATVVIDSRPDPISTTVAALGGALPSSILATQIDIIQSTHVAERVVRMLRLGDIPSMRKRWESETDSRGSYEAWMGGIISKGLEVRPARESNVIEIQYDGNDPAFAATVANAFAQAYIETTVQMRNAPARQYSEYFEERARQARSKLETAQTKLAEAQRQRGIIATEERLDVEMARLAELSNQVLQLKAVQVEAGTRSNQARRSPDQINDVLINPLIGGIKSDISRQEARLEELNARYGENHPLVQEANANLRALQARLRNETGKITASVGITDTIASTRLSEALKAYDDQRAKVLSMKDQRTELTLLETEVLSAQRIYDTIQLRQSQSSLESNAGQAGVVLLNAATEPAKHSSPRMLLNMVVAAVMGALLGLMAAFGAELFDRRVRSPFDLIQTLDLPVIGILPDPSASKKGMFRRLKKGPDPSQGSGGNAVVPVKPMASA